MERYWQPLRGRCTISTTPVDYSIDGWEVHTGKGRNIRSSWGLSALSDYAQSNMPGTWLFTFFDTVGLWYSGYHSICRLPAGSALEIGHPLKMAFRPFSATSCPRHCVRPNTLNVMYAGAHRIENLILSRTNDPPWSLALILQVSPTIRCFYQLPGWFSLMWRDQLYLVSPW